jgi:hypothetical protein
LRLRIDARLAGSASNGAGKTALASAAIWALSGNLAAWYGAGGRLGMNKGAVLNHTVGVKRAKAVLTGKVGDKAFRIERSATAKGRGADLANSRSCQTATLFLLRCR